MGNAAGITKSIWEQGRQLLEAGALSSVLEKLVCCATALGERDADAVTIALADSQHEVRHLLAENGGPVTRSGQILFVDTVYALAPSLTGAREPWFGPFARSDHQLLFPDHDDLSVVGLAPLVRQNRLIGSVNIGSADSAALDVLRDSRGLEQLGVMAALAIENALNVERLRRSGFVDLLTGWHNQQYIETRLREEVARSERERCSLACMIVDIDNFRALNTRYGYRAGDEVLLEVVQRLDAVMRRSDIAARYGSEEFVLLLPNTEREQRGPLVDRIQRAISSRPFDLGVTEGVPVTVSIGVAEYRPGGIATDPRSAGGELFARAQLALYESQARRGYAGQAANLE